MIIEFHNSTHLGDCLFQLEFQEKLKAVNPQHNFILYCREQYHGELYKAYPKASIDVYSNHSEQSFDTWIGKAPTRFWYGKSYNEIYRSWFQEICMKLKLENPIFKKEDILFCNPEISKPKQSGAKEIDVLLIDAQPMSGQFTFVAKHFDNLEKAYLHAGYSVQRTSKMQTSLIEIARLKVSIVHGIHTSPLLMLLNKNNVGTKFIIYDRRNHFDFWKQNYIEIKQTNSAEAILKGIQEKGKRYIAEIFKQRIDNLKAEEQRDRFLINHNKI